MSTSVNQQLPQQQRDIEKFIIDPQTKEKFVNLFMGIHKCEKGQAEMIFQNESFAFMKIIAENPDLNDCTQLSIRGCFLEAVNSGLSFSKAKGHVYISYRHFTVKNGNQSSREKRMVWDASPDGHVYLRQRVGSVQMVTTPKMIYDCDDYKIIEGDNPSMYHSPKLPRPSGAKIVLGYCYVVDEFGKKNLFWMDQDAIERLKKYSEKNNGEWIQENGKWKKIPGKANDLYSNYNQGIDPGFFAAKLKKFAVKDYRKSELPALVGEHMDELETSNISENEMPQNNENTSFSPTIIIEPIANDSEVVDQPNEFHPDNINDLPIIDETSKDENYQSPIVYNNEF